MTLIDADVISVKRTRTFFGKAIRWFTRVGNESPTYATHIAMIVRIDDAPYVIEASWKVKITPYSEWNKNHNKFAIFRKIDLSEKERHSIVKRALKYDGNFYGFFKILLHGADLSMSKLFGKDVFLFRKLQFVDRYPICNWLVAYSYYDIIGYEFGLEPKLTDPDSMTDHMRKASDFCLKFIKFSEETSWTKKLM